MAPAPVSSAAAHRGHRAALRGPSGARLCFGALRAGGAAVPVQAQRVHALEPQGGPALSPRLERAERAAG